MNIYLKDLQSGEQRNDRLCLVNAIYSTTIENISCLKEKVSRVEHKLLMFETVGTLWMGEDIVWST